MELLFVEEEDFTPKPQSETPESGETRKKIENWTTNNQNKKREDRI